LGVIEYSQFTHAAQVVSNASRRGARLAARNETVSAVAVESYVKDFITGSFANLTTDGGSSFIVVDVHDSAGVSIADGDLSVISSGTPIVVDVSFDFASIRVLNYFASLNQKLLQTSTVARRE
jgi:Flp pilus assembly protein TadG